MSRTFAIITFVSVIIATSAAVLCIVLIPFLNQTKSTYQFVLSSEGKLKWITQDGANEKLMVFSSSLNKTNNQLEEETATPCGSVSVAVKEYEELNSNKAEVFGFIKFKMFFFDLEIFLLLCSAGRSKFAGKNPLSVQ